MTRYIARRLVLLIPVLIGVTILVFLTISNAPGDPVINMLGREYTDEVADALRRQLGLDKPVIVQYFLWLGRALQGDLGRSFFAGEPALTLVMTRLINTALLTITSMIISVGIAIPLGVLSAVHKGRWVDNLSRIVSMIGVSMPVFWMGLLLLVAFALYLDWFPAGGSVGDKGWKALVLPSIALGTGLAALVTRMTRSSMVETLSEAYVTTARSKGLGESVVYYRHALKNALLPVVTVVGMQFGSLLSGAVVTETIFAIPGLGRLFLESILRRDFPVIQASILVTTFTFAFMNLLVDIGYAFLDPRIRYE
jgi:ABC-type dipeptide/oligopeptide/nickel transport system permease component